MGADPEYDGSRRGRKGRRVLKVKASEQESSNRNPGKTKGPQR